MTIYILAMIGAIVVFLCAALFLMVLIFKVHDYKETKKTAGICMITGKECIYEGTWTEDCTTCYIGKTYRERLEKENEPNGQKQ